MKKYYIFVIIYLDNNLIYIDNKTKGYIEIIY